MSPTAPGVYPYDAAASARRIDEPPKRAGAAAPRQLRSEFERDRARVLHSYAFRRLADKTQVVVPGEDDFPRTRLTHSLEVAQIGREIGAALGCHPDVVDTAGLAHDIGHPPFGHNGEDALDLVAASCGGFEGNAQTLRVLTRLEAKVIDTDGRPGGLNLTRAALDAVCKYPWQRGGESRKFGFYEADRPAFEWLRAGAPEGRRCLEAQIMDWADDVAYSVHDVEDGVHAGLVRIASVDDATRQRLCELAAMLYSPLSADELAPVLEELLELPTLRDLADYDGSYAAQAAAKRATSELVGRFAGAAVVATRAAYGREPLGRYDADLVVPAAVAAECALLKALAVHYVMGRTGAAHRQAWQRRLLTELAEVLLAGGPDLLDRALVPAWRSAADDAGRLRVVVDQIAQLTDTSATAWHERYVGVG
ncbi:deoxyguanosinetriphosphate triphosphohydrolase [Jatrophihabitans sp.]|uniref:deoxyguanosinetriphosphate triphosphohydrolase n=1 Tax=Jatrophihabitans sp. TaxID=1932789 RepID=UPI0030C6A6CC|nr:deoxyguanosinetriphosphate triphosphohydrolase [Jatrophihabitans sp.]